METWIRRDPAASPVQRRVANRCFVAIMTEVALNYRMSDRLE